MNKFSIQTMVSAADASGACDFLARKTGLSKSKIKDAMNKGAFWLRRGKGKTGRLRRATAHLKRGDMVEFHYDEKILAAACPESRCIADHRTYSVWFKPAGVMAQGTKYADHCSLLRQAEIFFQSSRDVYPVHRLDREVPGITILAHNRQAAAKLSALFRENRIQKTYRAQVLGISEEQGKEGIITLPLDGKIAHTKYHVDSVDERKNVSTVTIIIMTGRFHQIRRHLEMTGHPVIGDPRYGQGNKNTRGMRLVAVSLEFHCPILGKDVLYAVPEENLPGWL